MKRTMIGIGGIILAAGLIGAGCGGDQQQQAETQTAQPETTAQTAEEYPIDWCVVSGQKLGSMGPPVELTYAGRTVKLCCRGCVSAFEAEPDAYLAKLDSAAAGLITAPRAEPAVKGGTGGDDEG